MNELLGLPSRVLVAVIDGGVGIDDALCDREQVAFLGECTVGIGIIIMILLCVGVVLVSGARTKEKVLDLLKKTVLFIGALISLCGVIVVFGDAPELNTAGIIAANLAVAGLPLLYAMIVRIIVEVMLFRKKYSTPYEVKY